MKAKFIYEAIKHLKPRTEEEIRELQAKYDNYVDKRKYLGFNIEDYFKNKDIVPEEVNSYWSNDERIIDVIFDETRTRAGKSTLFSYAEELMDDFDFNADIGFFYRDNKTILRFILTLPDEE
jgi:hypothetical protein